jgi:hypothetical protein
MIRTQAPAASAPAWRVSVVEVTLAAPCVGEGTDDVPTGFFF